MSSTPGDGSSPLSQSDAISMLLDNEAPQETEVSESVEATPEEITDEVVEPTTEETEVEATEDGQVETEETEVEDDDEPYYTVKVDGEEYDVNQAERIKCYQLEKTAQKRLSDAAEQRKAIEADKTAVEQERLRYAQALQQIQAQLATQNQSQKTQADWNALYESDPLEYVRQRETMRDQQSQMQAVQQEQAIMAQQNLVSEQAKLLEFIPEWKDAGVATKEKTELVSYLKGSGFSENDVANATDARIITLARKAQLYDNLLSKKSVVKKKVGSAPKMVRSGQPKGKIDVAQSRKGDAFSKLSKTGSRDAAVEYLLSK